MKRLHFHCRNLIINMGFLIFIWRKLQSFWKMCKLASNLECLWGAVCLCLCICVCLC